MIHVDVTIMGQPYKLACKADEARALREAANLLDKKMSAIRDTGKIKGNDRIAVMAALGWRPNSWRRKAPTAARPCWRCRRSWAPCRRSSTTR